MYIVKPSEMKEIDQNAIKKIGIDASVLMNNAAKNIYYEVKKEKNITDITVFAGKGNNGGDVLVASRMLFEDEYEIKVLLLADYEDYKNESKKALDVLINLGVSIEVFTPDRNIKADLILDGIFGTGFMGEIKDPYKTAIERINASDAIVISADIPSGINGQTGVGALYYVKANKTVTFGAYKTGFFQNEGIRAVGKLILATIDIPKKAYKDNNIKRYILDSDTVSDILPKRTIDSNKGTYNKALIIAGSTKMAGAGMLSALGALRCGVGLLHVLTSKSNVEIYQTRIPEAIIEGVEETKQGYFSKDVLDYIVDRAKAFKAVGVGPGLGNIKSTKLLIKKLASLKGINLIIDADGLNAISDDLDFLKKAEANIIITPHPGEMGRLMNKKASQIQANRLDYAKIFAEQYNVIVLLKGYNTIICDVDGTMHINTSGNNALSKGGTGDVLTGMICGFATYTNLYNSALIATFVHGMCADKYIKKHSSLSLAASEIGKYIPKVLKELEDR